MSATTEKIYIVNQLLKWINGRKEQKQSERIPRTISKSLPWGSRLGTVIGNKQHITHSLHTCTFHH